MTRKLIYFCIIFCLPLSLFSIELTSKEQAYLQTLGTIKACVDPDWAPFETLSATGKYEGIGADLLFLIAQRLGIKIEVLHTKDWDETVVASKEGKCQIMSFLNQTPARDKWLIFTEPHFSDPNVFITREEHPFIANPAELVDQTIVFPKGTAMEERIRNEYPNLKVVTTLTEMDAFNLVSDKKADMTLRSLIVAAYTIKKEGFFNLKIAGQLPNYTNQLRIGVIKSEPMLRDILNKGVATISARDRESIVNQHIIIKAQTVVDYSLVVKIIIGFLVIALAAVYRYYEMTQYNKKLLYLSQTDILTRICNRTKTDHELSVQMERAKRTQEHFSVLLLDIDFFKKINDTFGHPMGDTVLIQIASIIQQSIRSYDVVGRWGGEEFLILCPQSNQEIASQVAERIRENIKNAQFPTKKVHTASIGVSMMTQDDTPHTLVARADKALYRAKNGGRDNVVIED